MSAARLRLGVVVSAGVLVLAATAVFGVVAWADRRVPDPAAGASTIATGQWAGGDRIVFRSTAPGDGYGHVASVPLAEPTGPRTVSGETCDRVDATVEHLACLRIVRGVVPTYAATMTDSDGATTGSWPLPGIPNRTRFSPTGELVATTSFVTGHSYATVGFSTATVIARRDGTTLGDLEDWTLVRGGEVVSPVDRNYWGVTFADDETFYATVGMTVSGETWLVRGDIRSRTLTALAENVECPSLSPDGSRIAFKRVTGSGAAGPHWTPAVYDIPTGAVRTLPDERNVDDQIEWLDDQTILYGMPRDDAPGDSDVWQLRADGSTGPTILIEHAWSPAVVPAGTSGSAG